MATTYGNISTATALNTAVIITKPVGLSVDDVMVAVLTSQGAGATQTWSPPAGWDSINSTGTTSGGISGSLQYFWKKATASDVLAASFSFSGSLGGGEQRGTIFSVSGTTGSAPSTVLGVVTAANTVTTTGLTPSSNSLLVIVGIPLDATASSVTQASYAITTSNPTWTEQLDAYSSTQLLGHAVATASRPAATATSTSTVVATPNAGTIEIYWQVLFAFAPVTAISMTADAGSYSLTGFDATLTFNRPNILNISKPTSTMINTSKP
jgi:hypothetical protein